MVHDIHVILYVDMFKNCSINETNPFFSTDRNRVVVDEFLGSQ